MLLLLCKYTVYGTNSNCDLSVVWSWWDNCDQLRPITVMSIWGIRQILLFAHALCLALLYLLCNNNIIWIFNYTQITKNVLPSICFENKTFIQLHTQWFKSCFSLHMRKNVNRKYNSPTKNKAYPCLAISEMNKMVLYILYIVYWMYCDAFVFHWQSWRKIYYMPIITWKGIPVLLLF